jgi:hypothetical protein
MWGICSACLANATLQHIIGPGLPRYRPIMGRVGCGVRDSNEFVCYMVQGRRSLGFGLV